MIPHRGAEIEAGPHGSPRRPLGGSPSYVWLPPFRESRTPASWVVRMATNRIDHGAKSAPKAPTISPLRRPTPNQWSLHSNNGRMLE